MNNINFQNQNIPIILCIMDGWGINADVSNNAVKLAKTPNFDYFDQHELYTPYNELSVGVIDCLNNTVNNIGIEYKLSGQPQTNIDMFSPIPRPPYFSGTVIPNNPISPIFFIISSVSW